MEINEFSRLEQDLCDQIFNKYLKIEDQPLIKSLKFLQDLPVTNLFVQKCESLTFVVCPTNIVKLRLEQCKLRSIDGIEAMINLKLLKMCSQEKLDFHCIQRLTRLNKLYLGNNNITDISFLKPLVNLRDLSLSCNNLGTLSTLQNLQNLKNLTILDLAQTEISNISTLSNLVNLTDLYLWDNQISDIYPLSNLKRLRSVELGENSVVNISPLRYLTQLEELYLANNKIVNINPITSLKSLKSANLSENFIIDLQPALNHVNAQKIYISDQNQPDTKLILLSQRIQIIYEQNEITNTSDKKFKRIKKTHFKFYRNVRKIALRAKLINEQFGNVVVALFLTLEEGDDMQ
ncbi:leucine-rich_repeat domain-containing protein [Hexamita inflata]|uniref:Leucine-rich_repeat domain-containing protein n=1 Tax=Hexamita inflata TaxID=28002 RepID=A0ABP1HE82_9EUKA